MNTKMIRPVRIVAVSLGAVMLAVTVSLLTGWAHHGGQRAAAETPGQTDLAIAIDVNGDSINDCDTIVATAGTGSTCTVFGTSTFGVKELVRFIGAGITDTNGNSIKEYAGVTWTLNYTAGGLMRVNSGTAQVLAGACTPGSMATSEGSGTTSFTCHGSASSFIGAILRIDFACSGTGLRTITMKAAPDLTSQTWLHNEVTHAQTVSKDSDETLTINCVSTVGGVAELSGLSGSAANQPASSSGGVDGWLLADVIAAVAAGAAAVGGAFWYQRQRGARARR